MHSMSNLDKFQDLYQILEKIHNFVFWKKKFKDS